MDKKHPAAIAIIAKMKKPEHMEDEEQEPDEGKLAAAQEMMDAMRKGDHHEFAEALEAFMQMCM